MINDLVIKQLNDQAQQERLSRAFGWKFFQTRPKFNFTFWDKMARVDSILNQK